jgi:hypothetical protein
MRSDLVLAAVVIAVVLTVLLFVALGGIGWLSLALGLSPP